MVNSTNYKSIFYAPKIWLTILFGVSFIYSSSGQTSETNSSNNSKSNKMENTNLQIVQGIYGHIGQGNVNAVFDVLADDAQYVIPGSPDIPYAGTFNGKQEIGTFYKKLSETLQYTGFEITSFDAVGNKVFVEGNFAGTVKSTEKPMQTDWLMIWTLENGKVIKHQTFIDSNNIAKACKK